MEPQPSIGDGSGGGKFCAGCDGTGVAGRRLAVPEEAARAATVAMPEEAAGAATVVVPGEAAVAE